MGFNHGSDNLLEKATLDVQDTNISALADLQGIMQRTEDGMLAVQPCTTADAYFAGAILPHREVNVLACLGSSLSCTCHAMTQ